MVFHLTPLSPQILRLLKGLLCPAGTNYTQHKPSCMVRCVSFVPARQRSSSEREMWEVCGRQAPRDRNSDWGRSRVCSSPASSPNAYKKGEAEGLLPWWPAGKPAVATAGLALLLVLLWSMAEGVQESTSISGSKLRVTLWMFQYGMPII